MCGEQKNGKRSGLMRSAANQTEAAHTHTYSLARQPLTCSLHRVVLAGLVLSYRSLRYFSGIAEARVHEQQHYVPEQIIINSIKSMARSKWAIGHLQSCTFPSSASIPCIPLDRVCTVHIPLKWRIHMHRHRRHGHHRRALCVGKFVSVQAIPAHTRTHTPYTERQQARTHAFHRQLVCTGQTQFPLCPPRERQIKLFGWRCGPSEKHSHLQEGITHYVFITMLIFYLAAHLHGWHGWHGHDASGITLYTHTAYKL